MEGSEHCTPSKSQLGSEPQNWGVAIFSPAAQHSRNFDLMTHNYCIQCAMKFDDDTSHTAHSKSEEHAIMVLVTGVAYFEREAGLTGFPPLYYCVLCNVFSQEYNEHETHLKSEIHKEMAHFLRTISFWKERILVGMKCKNKEPQTAQEFEDLKTHPPNYCQLCDKQCNSVKTLENHIQGQQHRKYERNVMNCEFCNLSFVNFYMYENHFQTELHAKVKDFKLKMLIPECELEARTPEKKSYVSQSPEVKPRPLLYFCKLCSIEFNDAKSFSCHKKISIHVRVHKLINKISLPNRKSAAMLTEIATEVTVSRVHYCELCKIWCVCPSRPYEEHVRSPEHLHSRSTYVVQKWDCSPQNPPLGHKPWN